MFLLFVAAVAGGTPTNAPLSQCASQTALHRKCASGQLPAAMLSSGTLRVEVVRSVIAPEAGRVEKKSRKHSDKWKPVFLLVELDMWWVKAKGEVTCPEDTKAWRNGEYIELVRGVSEVHKVGEFGWVVKTGREDTEFRVDTAAAASGWLGAIQGRVCPWPDLLRNWNAGGQLLLGSFGEGNLTAGSSVCTLLEMAETVKDGAVNLVEVLEAVGSFTEDVLGALPVAGAALRLLGFALGGVKRAFQDSEKLDVALNGLAQITKDTFKQLCRAFCREDEEYVREFAQLLERIEAAARVLKFFENRSLGFKYLHALFDLKTGPVAVLESIKECEEQLLKLENHKTAEQVDDIHTGRDGKPATALQVYRILVLAMLPVLVPQKGIVVLESCALCCPNGHVNVVNL